MHELIKASSDEQYDESNAEQEQSLDRTTMESLMQQHAELKSLKTTQQGMEEVIESSGLQVVADKYGAEALIGAMAGKFSIREVYNELAPKKSDQEALYDEISDEDISALAGRMNDELGGVYDPNIDDVRQMELFHDTQTLQIKGWRGDKGDGQTESAFKLLTRDFDSLMQDNPELIEQFSENNDTLALLAGVRSMYEDKQTGYAEQLDDAKRDFEQQVATAENDVAERFELTEAIEGDEIAGLEKRLEELNKTGESESTKADLIHARLAKKVEKVTALRQEFNTEMQAVRPTITEDLGAQSLGRIDMKPLDVQLVNTTAESTAIKSYDNSNA